MGILVKSTPIAIAAAEAIYLVFSKSKAIRKAPLNAPPVPIKPAKKPDRPPPIMALLFVAENLNSGLKVVVMENIKRKIPRINLKIS
jgi:hypothetical protein